MAEQDDVDNQEQRRERLMVPQEWLYDGSETAEDGTTAASQTTRGSEADAEPELPERVIDEAERLTRRARESPSTDEQEMYLRARRKLLSSYQFTARVREEERAVLVLYPSEWMEDGTVQLDRVADTSRGIERPLEGAGEQESWEAIEEHNRALAAAVAEEYGDVHGQNAHALADFMGNHYLKEIERASGEELNEFCSEYFPRNAWPSEEQQHVLTESIALVFELAETALPRAFDG